MSKLVKSVSAVATVLACVALGYAPSAHAAPAQTVPLTFTQQGRLLDDTGTPINGGALVFSFSLYGAATGGNALWTEEQSITPDQGYFSARLGESKPFPAALFNGSQGTLFLGITVGSDAEMAPRQQLTSTPFAMLSLNAIEATHALSADAATSATGALNTRIAALETTSTKLAGYQHVYGSNFGFTDKSCDLVTQNCSIDITPGGFSKAPTCVITMTNVDGTGYTENMVIRGTTATSLLVWKGQYQNEGTTMSVNFVCVGN